jgi:ABC-type proline/glycine betaine transport systems, ATPase components
MLMDEPFGATDPITREKLQAEFLRLQSEIGKTIIVVTHDFDEAIRLGDRIAVLSDRSQIEQFDTPAAILAARAQQTARQQGPPVKSESAALLIVRFEGMFSIS